MKKLRILLSAIAMVIALGVTTSFEVYRSANGTVDGYEFVTSGTPHCEIWPDECGESGPLCTVNGSTDLKDGSTASCGENLLKN